MSWKSNGYKMEMYGCPPTNKARKALKKVNILDDSVNSLPGKSDASDAYPAKTLWKISLFVDAWGGTDSCPTKLTAVSLLRNHYEQAHVDSQRSHFKINPHELDATTVRFSVDIAHQDSMSKLCQIITTIWSEHFTTERPLRWPACVS